MAKWLNTKKFTEIHWRIANQPAKIDIRGLFLQCCRYIYFPVLIRRELARKDPREDKVFYSFTFLEGWSGPALFIFAHFEVLLSCVTCLGSWGACLEVVSGDVLLSQPSLSAHHSPRGSIHAPSHFWPLFSGYKNKYFRSTAGALTG